MARMTERSLWVLFSGLVALSAMGCTANGEDTCRGIEACPADQDTLSFQRGAGELGGQPAIVLFHTPKGGTAGGATRLLAVWGAKGLEIKPPPDGWQATGAQVSDLPEQGVRWEWRASGAIGEAKFVVDTLRITLTAGTRTETYDCVAQPNSAVACTVPR